MNKFELTITAADQIKKLLQHEKNGSYFRISVLGGGCSGFQYDFSFTDIINSDDIAFSNHEIKYLIDKSSIKFIDKGTLDFVEELGGSYFKVENPNSTANCGCGTSFSI